MKNRTWIRPKGSRGTPPNNPERSTPEYRKKHAAASELGKLKKAWERVKNAERPQKGLEQGTIIAVPGHHGMPAHLTPAIATHIVRPPYSIEDGIVMPLRMQRNLRGERVFYSPSG